MIARRKFTQFFLSTLAAGTVTAVSRASSSVTKALSPAELTLEIMTATHKEAFIQDTHFKVVGVGGYGAKEGLNKSTDFDLRR